MPPPSCGYSTTTTEPRAAQLLRDSLQPAASGARWRCASCGEDNEAQFAACWNCGTADPRSAEPTLACAGSIALLVLCTALVALVSALPLGARLSWVLELTTHFRLQYLAVTAVLLALMAMRRRWGACAVLVAAGIVSAVPVLPYLPLGRRRACGRCSAAQGADGQRLVPAILGAPPARDRSRGRSRRRRRPRAHAARRERARGSRHRVPVQPTSFRPTARSASGFGRA